MLSNTTVRNAILDAWAVLMPVDCAGCGRPDRALCTECRTRLASDPTWHHLPDGTPVVSGLDYSGVARNTILAFKEKGRTDVTAALAAPLRAAIEAATRTAVLPAPELAPVPTSRAAYRRRGYDPVALLLRRTGFSRTSALRRTTGTTQQKALDLESRHQNLAGTMRATRPLVGRTFILIDDIMTTGATLTEAARAIREAGGEVIAAATVAYTTRHFPTRFTSS